MYFMRPIVSFVGERVADDTWKIQDTVLHMPVVIRDAGLVMAVFGGPAGAARRALAGTGLDPVVVGGRAFAVLLCVQYRDGDLGPYNEVGLAVAVRGPGGGIGSYVLELPVTQEFTLEAGRDIWALPKWLARCDLTIGRRRSTVHLADGDQFVLAGVLDSAPLRVPGTLKVTTTSFSHRPTGRLLDGTVAMTLTGTRPRPGGTRLILGEHRMADSARSLGLDRTALFTVTVPKLTMRLGNWD
jgi:hypothetical protein